jgi:hypothetical protein
VGAIDVPLAVVGHGRGHPLLDAHQVLARGCRLRDGKVELAAS